MRISLADIKEKAAPVARGMGLLILSVITFVVALWVVMTAVRIIIPPVG